MNITPAKKTYFHYTNIDSCISIIRQKEIACSSVKSSLLKGNADFLINQYLVPLIIKINSELSEKNISDLCQAYLLPLIYTSYIFSTTFDSNNSFHWEEYATEDGCCIEIKREALEASGRFREAATVCYDDGLFKNEHIQIFLRHYINQVNGIEKNMERKMNDETTAFVRAVAFSKYIEYEDDTEYRFLFQDLISIDEYVGRKHPNENIPPLSLSIIPEQHIQNIYFKSEAVRTEFLDRIGSTKEFWATKVKLI